MRIALLAFSALSLSACASQQERCIAAARAPLAPINRLLTQTQANIDRGYALTEVQDVRVIQTTCEGTTEEGATFRFPCEETETETREVPVTINIAEERVKLAQLQERRANASRTAEAQIRQCQATYAS